MFKASFACLTRHSPVWLVALFLLLMNFNETMSNAPNPIMFPPQEMQGKSYLPEDDSKWISELPKDERRFYTSKPYYLPNGLSNWEQFNHLMDHKIKKIRIFLIGTKDDYVHVTIKDPIVCRNISIALNPKYILRLPYSDVGRSHGGVGGGAALGAMQVHYEGVEKPVIIGIAKIGFYLDVWYGGMRHVFYSKALSVAVDQALRKYANYQMKAEYISAQSATDFFTLPEELKEKPQK